MKDGIVLRNITAQPSLQDATQEPSPHNCSFLANALEGIFRSTPAGRFTAVNPVLVRMLGYASAEEVLALTLPDDLYVDSAQRAHLRAAYEAGGVLEGIEARWKKKGGEHIIVSLYARTIRDTQGTVIGYEGMVLDITERKRMEEALCQSEARYRLISDLISDYAYAVRIESDGRTAVEWVTEAFSRMTGFTVQELEEGGGIVRVIHPEDLPSVLQRLSVLLSGQPGVSEHRIITKSGEVRWLRDYSYPEWDPIQSRVVRIIGAGQDITERKQMETERKASEAKYRLIYTASPDFLYLTDSAGKLLDANPALLNWQGLSLEALQQRHFLDFFAGDNHEEVVQAFAALQQGHAVHGLEVRARNRWGETREFEVNATPLPDLEGGTVILSVARDITERRRAEAAVLEERNRIAREVHDSMAQGFAGIVLQLEAAKRALTVNSHKAQVCLEEACALARAGLAEVRRSVMSLRPQVLEHNDLPTALARLAAQASIEILPQVTFRVHGSPHPLPVEVESNLLRITQEALANVCNHAQARDIAIDLTFRSHRVQLRVQDDGRGFDIRGPAGGNGFGLISMRERAEQIGGRFTVTSRPGKGTTVAVIVPNSRSF